jgi:hypothetical protein
VQIEPPCPDTCEIRQLLLFSCYEHQCIPNTKMIATRYGRGRMRLNASSCGSSTGSRSMLQKLSHDIEIGGFGSKASGTMSDYGECMKQGVHATLSNSLNVALSGCRSGQLRSSRSLGLCRITSLSLGAGRVSYTAFQAACRR